MIEKCNGKLYVTLIYTCLPHQLPPLPNQNSHQTLTNLLTTRCLITLGSSLRLHKCQLTDGCTLGDVWLLYTYFLIHTIVNRSNMKKILPTNIYVKLQHILNMYTNQGWHPHQVRMYYCYHLWLVPIIYFDKLVRVPMFWFFNQKCGTEWRQKRDQDSAF